MKGNTPPVVDMHSHVLPRAMVEAIRQRPRDFGMTVRGTGADEALVRDDNHGSLLHPEALAFTGIDPSNPLRGAVSEYEALHAIFQMVRKGIKDSGCNRAIMVAHNATFDLNFMSAAAERASLKRNPFHPFATFDTAALSGLVLGQTVLAKACIAAGMEFDSTQAHSALYDTQQTATLFCELVNRWKRLGGWPLPFAEGDAEATTSA